MRYTTRRMRQVLGLALTVTLAWGSAVAMAESQDLQKVDFVSLNGATEINLHAMPGIQHKTVHTSGNKLVIDLRGVSVTKTVRTNFIHARNVDNVVFQPLSNDKVRLIIRGENLGRPMISYQEPKAKPKVDIASALSSDVSRLTQRTNEAIDSVDHDIQAASNDGKLIIEDASSGQDEAIATLAADDPIADPNDIIDTGIIETGAIEPAVLTADDISGAAADIDFSEANAVGQPMNLKASPAAAATSQSFSSALGMPEALSNLMDSSPIPLPQTGIILAMLIGLGLFIRNKLTALRSRPSAPVSISGDTDNRPAPRNKRLSFRDLAQSRQQPPAPQNTQEEAPAEQIFSPQRHPKKANQWASSPTSTKKAMNNPVGLSALLGGNVQPKAKRPAKTAKRQAVNQYQKQAAPPPKKRPAKQQPAAQQQPKRRRPETPAPQQQQPTTPADPAAMNPAANHPLNPPPNGAKLPPRRPAQKQVSNNQRPITEAARQHLSNHAAAPQANPAAGNSNEPIPENTKVLDFLKNVADLMEQDGSHDKAQQINKGLRRGLNM